MNGRRLWIAGICALTAMVALDTIWLPVDDWDAVAIWYAKTRGLLEGRSLAQLPEPTYPFAGSAAWAAMLMLTGLEREPLARLVFPMLTMAWLASLPLMFPGLTRPRGTLTFSALLAIAVAAIDSKAVTSGYQDTVLCAMAGISAVLLTRVLLQDGPPSRHIVSLALVLAGTLGLIKNEGFVLAIVLVVPWMVLFVRTKGRSELSRAVSLPAASVFLVLVAFWPVATATVLSGLDHDRALGFEGASWGRLLDGIPRIPLIVDRLIHLSPSFGLTWAAAVAASVAGWKTAWTRPVLCWLWITAAVHTAWIVTPFMLTNADLTWHLDTALARLVSQHGFVWIMALAIGAVALTTPASGPLRQATEPRP